MNGRRNCYGRSRGREWHGRHRRRNARGRRRRRGRWGWRGQGDRRMFNWWRCAGLFDQLRESFFYAGEALLELGNSEIVGKPAAVAVLKLTHTDKRNYGQDGHTHDEECEERDPEGYANGALTSGGMPNSRVLEHREEWLTMAGVLRSTDEHLIRAAAPSKTQFTVCVSGGEALPV